MSVGECRREPLGWLLVVEDGLDVVPSSRFRCPQTLMGGTGKPPERDAFRADGRSLIANKWNKLSFDFLPASFGHSGEHGVREASYLVFDGLSKDAVSRGKGAPDGASRGTRVGYPDGMEGGVAGRCPVRWRGSWTKDGVVR